MDMHDRRENFMIYDADLRRQFKRSARDSIRERFWPTMGASLLVTIPALLLSLIFNFSMPRNSEMYYSAQVLDVMGRIGGASLFYLLLCFFVLLPISFGGMYYYTKRARGEETSPSMVFHCFGSGKAYGNALKLALSIFVRSIGWGILECLVIFIWVAGLIFAGIFMDEGGSAAPFILVMLIGGVLAIFFSLLINVKIRRYDGAYIRLIDDPDMGAWRATGECAETFRGHNWELFVFDLSFLLWEIVSVLTLGIVGIYVSAYMNMAFINYFDALREHETGVSPSGETL